MDIRPIVKWAGGKHQLLNEILPMIPTYDTYCEPFLGGGAVLLALCPTKAIVNDINDELINMYKIVKSSPEKLITSLRRYKNTNEDFYRIRDWDRNKTTYAKLSPIRKAARLLYLNKTCYNGLYRVNSEGQFNAPYGRYVNPQIINKDRIMSLSKYFNTSDVNFFSEDFAVTLKRLNKGDFAYIDPPYDPLTESASFTGYSKDGFGKSEQQRLKSCCDKLNDGGVKFLLSNSATNFIKDLYSQYNVKVVQALRNINSNGSGRGAQEELLVWNYDE